VKSGESIFQQFHTKHKESAVKPLSSLLSDVRLDAFSSHTFSVLPYTRDTPSVFVGVLTFPVHLASNPLSFIFRAILPDEDAISLLDVVNVLALVAASVRPQKDTAAVHVAIAPLAVV
jgi:hypothetical protein